MISVDATFPNVNNRVCGDLNHLIPRATALTHLPSGHVLGVFVELVDVGAEGLEVRDHKLLPEGLGEQHDVALDTSEERDGRRRLKGLCSCPLVFARAEL